ncbi:DegT/DnrJ/EryC1/StrS family aminotransferase [Rhizobium sp. VS19-DR104.2]|uniref:DegT/DnrJ/EryC1/StrS family aminotransferase n=1 Tax=unclassified Rhizobium TaxID=2613769 RepID=UPI001CC688DB|nr:MULTISPECIES: DegT/DnrJ/EryC1/StrS family aminotransferase [unclassified Rhizobium]MBZ5762312.1 DegT/DnrJ/EryC1/StrS family aminotransferase [Rhizobium sp. VS19-DR96]MBZ5768328.1 DegT/DnrJ/EryC1/StrS family aminotransferase [Rhizobium sp. VS19-DR129.2]MBZ5775800.1 DegT/DnrJ/EryC1/StrS family aminotransferase [Rhizobium sp. VS19-DRK62.2]MBZ5787179.1 DegT/DnrJ/EryC1/StrS family aminotransferase [Rhizobium sp. VS19-DR121]MBZ5804254.1 DegT/DnrJ/EryC1/StrS family aminotransferase [Rhizobium sp. 
MNESDRKTSARDFTKVPLELPTWPLSTERSIAAVAGVLSSGRWAISGTKGEAPNWEQKFCDAFAGYIGTDYAVATCNGTAALTIALEALGIGVGDEVIVPGLTWVACASAVLTVGAIPVLVDVDETFCLSPTAAANAITEKTRAILLVHAYCQIADLHVFQTICEERNLHLVEDCSQAHGAEWNGRKVGSFGSVSCFSLQQVKLLTCGEGGIALTSDRILYDRMQELRADGRRYNENARPGEMDLKEFGSIQGRNYCLSEIQSALAFAQLQDLDQQNARRRVNADTLDRLLGAIAGVSTPKASPNITSRVFYQYLVRVDPAVYNYDPDWLAREFSQQLGVYCELIDRPLNSNALYVPHKTRRFADSGRGRERIDPQQYGLPISNLLQKSHIAISHWLLLAEPDQMDSVAVVVSKIISDLPLVRDAVASVRQSAESNISASRKGF